MNCNYYGKFSPNEHYLLWKFDQKTNTSKKIKRWKNILWNGIYLFASINFQADVFLISPLTNKRKYNTWIVTMLAFI